MVGREMSFYRRTKVFGEKCLGYGISPAANTAAIFALALRPCTSVSAPKLTLMKVRRLCVEGD